MLTGFILPAVAGETATDILSRAAAKYKSLQSISATFRMTAGGQTGTGSLTVAGNRFAISTRELSTWFDGKTQWTYSPSAAEVNITEPTAEELQQVNPFAIINAFSKSYKATFDGARTAKSCRIRLTPVNPRSDIASVIITINTSTLFPSRIVVTDRRKQTTDITVTSIAPGGKRAVSDFRWNSRQHPGVEVVDLR